jgi:PEP-CTERM motif
MKRAFLFLAVFAFLMGGVEQAKATTVFSENFDTGSATYTTNDPYWLSNPDKNGFIVKTSAAVGGFGAILTDVSGAGYFLFNGTASYPSSTPNVIPNNEFYISPTFTVAKNTNYTVSFWLTNENAINNAAVAPELGGTVLGAPVSAVGTYPNNGWQQFTYTWNSGNNTTASLILHDLQTSPSGNDFGLDEISIATVAGVTTPEPATLTLLAVGIAGVTGYGWRRRKQAA